jgi:UDP-glucose 4-epimerase
MKKALVVGGAGFIGSHVVDALIESGLDIVVLDDLSTGSLENVNKKAAFVRGDVCDDRLDSLIRSEKPNYVYHLAAQINLRDSIKDPCNDARINIHGSLNLIDSCAKNNVEKFIFSSTGGAIYSEVAPLPWNEGSKALPASPYGLSKATVERYLKLYRELYGLEYVSLRYSNVFGPRQNSKGEAGVVSIFIDRIRENKEIVIFGDGNQTRDFVYVSDVAYANLLALNGNFRGTFNVSTGKATSVNKIAALLLETMESTVGIRHETAILGELRHSILDSSKLKKFRWEPRIKLSKGIKKTVKYILQS